MGCPKLQLRLWELTDDGKSIPAFPRRKEPPLDEIFHQGENGSSMICLGMIDQEGWKDFKKAFVNHPPSSSPDQTRETHS